MLGLVTMAGSALIKGASTWWNREQEEAEAESDAKITMLKSRQSHNQSWEIASLRDKDKWMRRVSFILFVAPFVVAIWDPDAVKAYFVTALDPIPEWYKKIVVTMVGGIWGASALKSTGPAMVSALKKAFKE